MSRPSTAPPPVTSTSRPCRRRTREATLWKSTACFSSSPSSDTAFSEQYLDEKQLENAMGYLNKHHRSDVLVPFTKAFSSLGETFVKKNMWMGGSYVLKDAKVVDITFGEMTLEATVEERGNERVERVSFSLDADPVPAMAREFTAVPPVDGFRLSSTNAVDNFVRRMVRLCNVVKAHSATGKLIQLGVQIGGEGVGKLVGGAGVYAVLVHWQLLLHGSHIIPFLFFYNSTMTCT